LDQNGWRDSGEGPGSTEGSYINWLTFTDNAKSVEDVMRIRNHPLVPNDIPIYGYIYDVKSGILVEVPEATTAGKAGWGITATVDMLVLPNNNVAQVSSRRRSGPCLNGLTNIRAKTLKRQRRDGRIGLNFDHFSEINYKRLIIMEA
jgi:hypothetical protein